MLLKRKAHAFLCQEHSTPPSEIFKLREEFKGSRCQDPKQCLSCLDPEVSHNLGGLAAIARRPRSFVSVVHKTKTFGAARATGRVDVYSLDIGSGVNILVFNVYGYSGGNQSKKLAARTDRLLRAILDEVQAQPKAPTLIVGDLNGDVEDFPIFAAAVKDGIFCDLGASAHVWNRPTADFTCTAAGTNNSTRRDFVFANNICFPMVSDFNVHHTDDFLVHDVLQIALRPNRLPKHFTFMVKPISMFDTFLAKFESMHPKTGNSKEDKATWDSFLCSFHTLLDSKLLEVDTKLIQLIASGRNDDFWQQWNIVVEKAYLIFMGLDSSGPQACKHKGRGKLQVKRRSLRAPPVNSNLNLDTGVVANSEICRLQAQANRAHQWADRLVIMF